MHFKEQLSNAVVSKMLCLTSSSPVPVLGTFQMLTLKNVAGTPEQEENKMALQVKWVTAAVQVGLLLYRCVD